MTYLYLADRPTVHLVDKRDLTLCGVNRGTNRLKQTPWLHSQTWRAINGKKRILCRNCKKKRRG